MEQDAQYLKKRFIDLSKRAEDKNIVTFSNFLNLNELNIFHQISRELYSSFQISGGYEHAERQMAAFIPDALSYTQEYQWEYPAEYQREHPTERPWKYPIKVLRITPSHPKFAEALTHRDVLGALMNLGIKRETLGDILMLDEGAVLLCMDSVSGYIIDSCTKIRHTMVECRQIPPADFTYKPKMIEKEGIVSSLRLDTIIADVCKLPRTAAQKIIIEGNAFINARKIQQNGYNCQNGDILSVRHFGKFQIESVEGTTKKGRIKYRYKVYS